MIFTLLATPTLSRQLAVKILLAIFIEYKLSIRTTSKSVWVLKLMICPTIMCCAKRLFNGSRNFGSIHLKKVFLKPELIPHLPYTDHTPINIFGTRLYEPVNRLARVICLGMPTAAA